jgi:hypothetical protein
MNSRALLKQRFGNMEEGSLTGQDCCVVERVLTVDDLFPSQQSPW